MNSSTPTFPSLPAARRAWVAGWLFTIAGMVFLMVLLGGVTRLTDSGLSMVSWRPITGWLPPITDAEWRRLFAAYQETPEFRHVNPLMDVHGFKGIFWLEYLHRLFGRMIGLAFFFPFVFFLVKGWLPGVLKWRCLGLFVLGGLQGGLGWYMVKSGLIDEPDVSQYRLAAHLGLALAIYVALLWTALGVLQPRQEEQGVWERPWSAFLGFVFLTAVSGAFVAGLDAGRIFTDFPFMYGGLLPPDGLSLSPWRLNFFENPATVQFQHRVLALTALLLGVFLWRRVRQSDMAAPQLKRAAGVVVFVLCCQVALGVITLWLVVPLPLAALHQAGAVILLSSAVFCRHVAGRGGGFGFS